MITWIYDSQKTMQHQGDCLNGEDVTAYCKGKDVANLPTKDVPNAAKAYVFDWFQLDEGMKSTIGNQILMFDAEDKAWLPQGKNQ